MAPKVEDFNLFTRPVTKLRFSKFQFSALYSNLLELWHSSWVLVCSDSIGKVWIGHEVEVYTLSAGKVLLSLNKISIYMQSQPLNLKHEALYAIELEHIDKSDISAEHRTGKQLVFLGSAWPLSLNHTEKLLKSVHKVCSKELLIIASPQQNDTCCCKTKFRLCLVPQSLQ